MNHKTFIYHLLETPMEQISFHDVFFLHLIIDGYTSAYSIHRMFTDSYKEYKLSNPEEPEVKKPIAYININKRFRRFHKLGILEEVLVDGGYKHGARHYRISDKGLVTLIANGFQSRIIEKLETLLSSNLFKTFILPYFEIETLRNCTFPMAVFIDDYLTDICVRISKSLDPNILIEYGYDVNIPLSKQYDLTSNELLDDPSYVLPPVTQILNQLKSSQTQLILDLLRMDEDIIKNHIYFPDKKERNEKLKEVIKEKQKSFQILLNDKKFMSEVKKIKNAIDASYTDFINSSLSKS